MTEQHKACSENEKQSWAKTLTRRSLLGMIMLGPGFVESAWALPVEQSPRYAAIVVDHRSGKVLHEERADAPRRPASLTKIMTIYLTFEAIRSQRLKLESRVSFSEHASSQPATKLGVDAGNSISVDQAILALVTKSANDVASAVAERLAGSEAAFANQMTQKARALGMKQTVFRNASGLPHPGQMTTARDMAILGRRVIQDFPQHYRYFGVTTARVAGSELRNHNRMLGQYAGLDGIKTGFINDSGFNIVTSAVRNGRRVVGVVFGGDSSFQRDARMTKLLDASFAKIEEPNRRRQPRIEKYEAQDSRQLSKG